jgi:hypothetical protein
VTGSLVAYGCGGGDGDKTFEGDGYSFTYPGGWDERQSIRSLSGQSSLPHSPPAEGPDALIFEVAEVEVPVTESNIDQLLDDAAGALAESTEGPTRATVGGLPGLRYVSHPPG